ncbi:MAG: hypothetical protein KIS67_14290 [Verrucomicrobiae bacterium]|nr:hypothetical protein [Verrucomicrobiae bacterium]
MKRFLGRLLRWAAVLFLLLVVALVARGIYAFRDRVPGYQLDLKIDAAESQADPRPLQVGFGRVKINPDLADPKRPVWIAGFGQKRAATGIHDDLWAIACVVDDGHARLGIVALDAIGFFHDDVVAVRRACAEAWKLNYVVVSSTHNHSTPDLMGLWGPHPLRSGVDPVYREQVIAAAVKALGDAVAALQPARVAYHELSMPTDGLVADTRKPIVFDPDVRVMHFSRVTDASTLGTIVGWANHPETPWSQNTELTADFCGFLRDALERGVHHQGRELAAGLGGIHVYVNGAVGGLMTTHPSVTVRDPYLQHEYKIPSHEKSRAVGHQLAARLLPALHEPNVARYDFAPIGIRARTIEMPIENNLFLAAAYLGVIDRGHVRWKRMRTEVALLTIGEASIACVPGEIYPEIINGGIETPPGADFDIEPVEVPPLRELMPGRLKFVFGLANDELGYLIPKSEWDVKPPFLYVSNGVYGEVNSCGPDAGRIIHAALAELCREVTVEQSGK